MRKLFVAMAAVLACLGVTLALSACGGGTETEVIEEPVIETDVMTETKAETDVETDVETEAAPEEEEATPSEPQPGDTIRLDNGKKVQVADPEDQGRCEPGRVEQPDGQCLPNQPSG